MRGSRQEIDAGAECVRVRVDGHAVSSGIGRVDGDLEAGLHVGKNLARRPHGPFVVRVAVVVHVYDLGQPVFPRGIDFMNDNRFVRNPLVIAGKQACLDRVEVGRRLSNGNLGHQIALGTGLSQSFEGNRAGAVGRGHILPVWGNPAQKVLVVGDGVDGEGTITGIGRKGLSPAHHIPSRVVGSGTKGRIILPIRPGGMQQAQGVTHLVGDSLVVVFRMIRVQPCDTPESCLSIFRQPPGAALGPSALSLTLLIKDEVDPIKVWEEYIGISDTCAIFDGSL